MNWDGLGWLGWWRRSGVSFKIRKSHASLLPPRPKLAWQVQKMSIGRLLNFWRASRPTSS
jgi:hypothetical protein